MTIFLMTVVRLIGARIKMAWRVCALNMFIEITKEVSKERMSFLGALIVIALLVCIDTVIHSEEKKEKVDVTEEAQIDGE